MVLPVFAVDSTLSLPAMVGVTGQSISRINYNARVEKAREKLNKLQAKLKTVKNNQNAVSKNL